MEDLDDYMGRIASRMRMSANRFPCSLTSQADTERAVQYCRRLDTKTGASLLFTKDFGHHTSGWWKNPDYDCCYHLSMAPIDALPEILTRGLSSSEVPSLTRRRREQWVKAFFGDSMSLVWVEPPVSSNGRRHEVFHYRVFIDEGGGTPLLPRGEVYTREFTAAGWKSWSDAQHLRK